MKALFTFPIIFLMVISAAAPVPLIAQVPANTWNFSDDEAPPTWGQDIRDQAPDLAMFAGFALLTFVGFFRKSELLSGSRWPPRWCISDSSRVS